MRKAKEEKQITQYFLGDLPEEEKIRLEERFFTDDQCFERVLAIEDDLIDTYVRDELSPSERQRFERHFLASPRRRQRVEFARALMGTVSQVSLADAPAMARTESTSWWQILLAWPRPQKLATKFLMATAALLVVLGGLGLIVETMRLRRRLERVQTERQTLWRQEQEWQRQLAEQRTRGNELAAQLRHERDRAARLQKELARPEPPFVVSFVLLPGLVRDTEAPKRLAIPPSAQSLRLQMDLEGDEGYKHYRAMLRTADGDEIWSQGRLRAQPTGSGKAVVLKLSPRLFQTGDYIVTLQGVTTNGEFDEVGDYYFSVVKR